MTSGSPAVHTTTAPFDPQVAEVDPGRAARIAVDQHARLLGRVVGDIAAVPHAADHVDERPAGGGAEAPRQLVRQAVAGIEHGAVAVIESAAAPNS